MGPPFIPMLIPSIRFARGPSRVRVAADATPRPGSPRRPPPTFNAERARVAVPLKATF